MSFSLAAEVLGAVAKAMGGVLFVDEAYSLKKAQFSWAGDGLSNGFWVNKGNHPQMIARFRLVKYYNLPIYLYRLFGSVLEEWSFSV